MAITVAFQGVPGAYSELAALNHFGRRVRPVPQEEFADVFNAVKKGRVAYGVIPIENSLTGSIHQNFDLLLKHDLWICGEVKLRISHALIAHKSARLKDIKRVFSHPQALWQCHHSLEKLKGLEPVPYFDTAGSARHIAEEGLRDAAALASQTAAARYGLKVLKAGLEDNKHNFTRFLVIQRKKTRPKSRRCKTSISFDLKSVPGALYLSLGVFAVRSIQLFKVESRPIPGRPWEYLFYLDFGGDIFAPEAREAVRALGNYAAKIRVFGSYPKHD